MINSDRVYIRFNSSICNGLQDIDIETLLEMVARTAKFDENGISLLCDNKLCRHRTIAYIVREANKYISGLNRAVMNEDMKLITSIRQINKLDQSFKKQEKCCFTGYTLVILHVILTILHNKNCSSDVVRYIKKTADEVNRIIQEYYHLFDEDEIAFFLLECYPPLHVELVNNRLIQTVEHFPAIPRRHI